MVVHVMVAAVEEVDEATEEIVGAVLSTVTEIVEVATFPAASLATALIVCAPLDTPVLSKKIEYGEVAPEEPVVVLSI